MEIKILGSGCANCIKLYDNTKLALQNIDIEAVVTKITDIEKIISYGVMSTPALVINEKVVSTGKLLKPKAIVKLLEKI